MSSSAPSPSLTPATATAPSHLQPRLEHHQGTTLLMDTQDPTEGTQASALLPALEKKLSQPCQHQLHPHSYQIPSQHINLRLLALIKIRNLSIPTHRYSNLKQNPKELYAQKLLNMYAQKLLCIINWVRPYIEITTPQFSALCNISRSDPELTSPRKLTPKVKTVLETVERDTIQTSLPNIS